MYGISRSMLSVSRSVLSKSMTVKVTDDVGRRRPMSSDVVRCRTSYVVGGRTMPYVIRRRAVCEWTFTLCLVFSMLAVPLISNCHHHTSLRLERKLSCSAVLCTSQGRLQGVRRNTAPARCCTISVTARSSFPHWGKSAVVSVTM